MRPRFALRAVRQIDAIYDYLVARDDASARKVLEAIHSAFSRFVDFPSMTRPAARPGTRRRAIARLPYVTVYAVDEVTGHVTILSVFHTRQARTEH